jgi:hypothetical protein
MPVSPQNGQLGFLGPPFFSGGGLGGFFAMATPFKKSYPQEQLSRNSFGEYIELM